MQVQTGAAPEGLEGRGGREPPDCRLGWEISPPSPLGFEGPGKPRPNVKGMCSPSAHLSGWISSCPSLVPLLSDQSPGCSLPLLDTRVPLRAASATSLTCSGRSPSECLSALLSPEPVDQETPRSGITPGLQVRWPHLLASCRSAPSGFLSPRAHTWGEVGLLTGGLQAGLHTLLLPVQPFPDGATQGHPSSRNACCPGHSPEDGIRTREPGPGGVGSRAAKTGQHARCLPLGIVTYERLPGGTRAERLPAAPSRVAWGHSVLHLGAAAGRGDPSSLFLLTSPLLDLSPTKLNPNQ